jgi:hypothetical protein
MKKAFWLASVVGLAVAAWATVETVPVQANYAAEQLNDEDQLARRRGGSSGSYGSTGGGRRGSSGYGSSGGGRRRGGRGGHSSYGSHG